MAVLVKIGGENDGFSLRVVREEVPDVEANSICETYARFKRKGKRKYKLNAFVAYNLTPACKLSPRSRARKTKNDSWSEIGLREKFQILNIFIRGLTLLSPTTK